mmetsp:Transcript_7695/g.34196  ORF Transcript_7695/g.34196 Transcript_7695/m.34196 type:complete len:271 (-) Transcript_7695:216-1028(-)
MRFGTRRSGTSSHNFRVLRRNRGTHSATDLPDSAHYRLLRFRVRGAERLPFYHRLVEALGVARLRVSSVFVEEVFEEICRKICAGVDLGVASLHKVQPRGNVYHNPFLADHSLPKWIAPVTVNLVDVLLAFRLDLTGITGKDFLRQGTIVRPPEEHPELLHDILHQRSGVRGRLKIAMSVNQTLPIEITLSIRVQRTPEIQLYTGTVRSRDKNYGQDGKGAPASQPRHSAEFLIVTITRCVSYQVSHQSRRFFPPPFPFGMSNKVRPLYT